MLQRKAISAVARAGLKYPVESNVTSKVELDKASETSSEKARLEDDLSVAGYRDSDVRGQNWWGGKSASL